MKLHNLLSLKLEHYTHKFAKWAGTSNGLIAASLSVTFWFIVGSLYSYSNRWENALSIYIGVITFLMIFLMQRSQNKELGALHLKLNELIAVTREADNQLINAEDLSEQEIKDARENHDALKEGKSPQVHT